MEESVFFESGPFKIHGLFSNGTGKEGVVITHPHPHYGGDMNNSVVAALGEVYEDMGFSTLRFNFRGVGKSEGSFGNGIGEQEDVLAAIGFLRKKGVVNIDLSGYSFGAWVNAHTSLPHSIIRNMVMVSPPVALLDFNDVGVIPSLKLVVTGELDEIAPHWKVEKEMPRWNEKAELRIIDSANHLYLGKTDDLKKVLRHYSCPLSLNKT